jgi:sugar-specific transcriptional regulator TrmB
MSLERVMDALVNLGLTRMDAEIYVYLAKKGAMKEITLDSALTYTKKQIYNSLRRLTTKELASKNGKLYSTIPFEEALDMLIKLKEEEAKTMNQRKKELLVNWKTEDY